jgi:hypothetical protein
MFESSSVAVVGRTLEARSPAEIDPDRRGAAQ